MAADLNELVSSWRTAVVTSEIQNGVIGDAAALPGLAAVARATMLPGLVRLVRAARAAGVEVVHGTFARRVDGKGTNSNARLFASVAHSPVKPLPGSEATRVVDEVGVAPSDIVLTRIHGLNPMAGTDLDPILRNLGVTTVVVAGVSVNVAVTNLVMDAVNRGYDVVVPRDAVCGVPVEYADAVIDHTLGLLATITTVDTLAAIWSS